MRLRLVVTLVVGLATLGCKSKSNAPPLDEPASPDDPVASPPVADPGTDQPEPEPPAGEPPIVVSDAPCETDQDCVPAECCHAAACTNTDAQPACDEVACTEECRYGTLDCGGTCLCQNGLCAAKLSVAPEGP